MSHAFFLFIFFSCWATLSSLSIKKRIILDILQVSRARFFIYLYLLHINEFTHKWCSSEKIPISHRKKADV